MPTKRTSGTSGHALKERLPAPLVVMMEFLMRFCAWVFILCLAYDIYVVASGGAAVFASLPFMDRVRIVRNLFYAGRLALVTGAYLGIYTFITGYDIRDRFFILLGIAGVFYFGIPFLLLNVLDLVHNFPAYEIATPLGLLAHVFGVIVLLRLLLAIVSLMEYGVGRSMAKLHAERDKMPVSKSRVYYRPPYRLSRCWELPFCRDYLLKVCPAWHKKKTCWKHGSGCMCDSSMMDRLMQLEMGLKSGPNGASPSAPRVQSGAEKCRTCSIYLSHEEEKYRLLSPIIPVAGLASLVLYWDWFKESWGTAAQWIAAIIAQIAIGSTHRLVTEWAATLQDPVFRNCALCFGMLTLVSYGLRFLEWAVLEQKW